MLTPIYSREAPPQTEEVVGNWGAFHHPERQRRSTLETRKRLSPMIQATEAAVDPKDRNRDGGEVSGRLRAFTGSSPLPHLLRAAPFLFVPIAESEYSYKKEPGDGFFQGPSGAASSRDLSGGWLYKMPGKRSRSPNRRSQATKKNLRKSTALNQ